MGTNRGCAACTDGICDVHCHCGRKTAVRGECQRDYWSKARRIISAMLFSVFSNKRPERQNRMDETVRNCVLSKDILAADLHISLELHCELSSMLMAWSFYDVRLAGCCRWNCTRGTSILTNLFRSLCLCMIVTPIPVQGRSQTGLDCRGRQMYRSCSSPESIFGRRCS